ncbi:cysteine proteinase [Paramicrosporidium saccamoebae]|uniref:Ubiquitin carboxyl-terminal hydrolase n=1 Tax=Paramicrosporidium saccamoebae TaxID=1246581 RepID=A0A2H9TPQ4_9FUNG|nr:cysteine proteinase [Paramicrosporidium saccamoebae]
MGSKKSSPTKVAAAPISEADEASSVSAISNTQPSQNDVPALIRCKHLSSMSDFLKMYHTVARRLHWGCEALCCAECAAYQSPLQVCLQCPRVACGHPANHQQTHSSESGHALSIEIQSGAMFCSVCKVWVWNDLMASVWLESRQSNSDASQTIAQFDKVQTWIAESGETAKRHCGNIRGLYNLGNTCFMNCILQTILHIEPLRKFFLAPDGPLHLAKTCPRARSNEACIACEMDSIFCRMYDGGDIPIAPNRMLESLWRISKDLAGYEQQDAHELFVTMRNTLHTHLEGAMYNCSCVVHRIFSGVLQSDLTCLQCGNVTETLDPFLDISLDIPPSMDGLDLEECLHRFTRAEHLPAGNYICSACHRNHPEIAKQLTIRSSPQILSIHLKRFEHGLSSTKIDTAIHFEEYLSLLPFMATGSTDGPGQYGYHLFAVTSHVGNLDSGHYTCFIKSRDQWFWIDDACVSACTWQEVVRCNAYMLFYICNGPSE